MNLERCTPSQRTVVTSLSQPLMVSAGAGSGKTFTLTQRVAHALIGSQDKPPALSSIDEVMAITFTKKAAAELKSRIKSLLMEEGLTDEALKVDNAWISTIHGMASHVLREYALEIGIDPAFEIIEDVEAGNLQNQALENIAERVQQSSDQSFDNLLSLMNLRGVGYSSAGVIDYAKQVLERVLAHHGGFETLAVSAPDKTPASYIRILLESGCAMQEALEAIPDKKPAKGRVDFKENLAKALEQADGWLSTAESDADFMDSDFDRELFAHVFYAFPLSAGNASRGAFAEIFQSWKDALLPLEEEVRAALVSRWLKDLIALAQEVDREYARIKGPLRLDNNDLLRYCYRALNEHPAIAEQLRDKFKLIMIDEFQDTDQMQVEIISKIAQPGRSNVCVVGDAQQSIYRFRGADVSVFLEYRNWLQTVADQGMLVEMAENFRSHGDILAFVEHIFEQPSVFGESFLNLLPRGQVNDDPDPIFQSGEIPRVGVYIGHTSQEFGSNLPDARLANAQAIARHFRQLRDQGAKPEDMVVLLGKMSNAELYSEALRQEGFESVITGGSVFSDMREPQVVGALVDLVENPYNEEALYQVLMSPLFALSDDALLVLASKIDEKGLIKHRSFPETLFMKEETLQEHVRILPEDEGAYILQIRSLLREYCRKSRTDAVSSALRDLLAQTGLFDRLAEQGSVGLASAANYNKALQIVEMLEQDACGIGTLSRLYREHLAAAKLTPGTLATSNTSFIQIMTVHASKGLEFAHVAVAELKDGLSKGGALIMEGYGDVLFASASFKPFNSVKKATDAYDRARKKEEEGQEIDLSHESAESAARLLKSMDPGKRYRLLKNAVADQELAEARRLLYVALTRASKSLYLTFTTKKDLGALYEGTGVLSDVYQAIQWSTEGNRAVSSHDYGGSAPLEVICEQVGWQNTNCIEGEVESAESADAEEVAELFKMPLREPVELPSTAPYKTFRQNVYSYSSLASRLPRHEEAQAAQAQEDARGWAEGSDEVMRPTSDADRATDLGSAFHTLAQQAILLSELGSLPAPANEQVAAQVERFGLSDTLKARLAKAIHRWFGSKAAQAFAAHEFRFAEVPFTLEVPAVAPFVLEGEIDGLAYTDESCAYLIDYKTGGMPQETPEQLFDKHLHQAQCYAYALLRSGFQKIEARFLRVEQEDPAHPGEPQIVLYNFSQEDLSDLEQEIISMKEEGDHAEQS